MRSAVVVLSTRQHHQRLFFLNLAQHVGVKPALPPGSIRLNQAAAAVSLVIPSWIVHNRVNADAINVYPISTRRPDFTTHVTKPAGTVKPFGAGFGDQQRPPVAGGNFLEQASKRPIDRVTERYRWTVPVP